MNSLSRLDVSCLKQTLLIHLRHNQIKPTSFPLLKLQSLILDCDNQPFLKANFPKST